MIDQLHRFDNEAQAMTALPDLLVQDEDGNPCWKTDTVSFPVVYDLQNTTTIVNADTGETTTQPTRLPYFYVWTTTLNRVPALEALPSCMIVADRDRADAGQTDFVLASALPSDQLSHYTVSGGPLGANYPFG